MSQRRDDAVDSLLVRCPQCNAAAGERCINLRRRDKTHIDNTHGPRRGYATLRKTLAILSDGPAHVDHFASRLWPERPLLQARLAAHSYLARLEGEGVVRQKHTGFKDGRATWEWMLTSEGRQLTG